MARLNYPNPIQTALDPSLGPENWSWWRRKLSLPTQKVRARLEVVEALESSINFVRRLPQPMWPNIVGQGIFGSSVCRLEMLDSRRGPENLQVPGWIYRANSTNKHRIECPFGRLTLSARQSVFSFDGREIGGMWSSKSSECYFSTICEFGASYTAYMKTTHDDAGLKAMLSHGEIRVIHGGADHMTIDLWDGRLFLGNSGGSHHLAGGIYIADRIKADIPLTARLNVEVLNEKAIQWMLAKFKILVVPKQGGCTFAIARALGECYELDVPPCISDNAKLVLMPIELAGVARVVDALVDAGAIEVGSWFENALSRQQRNRAALADRFGGRMDSEILQLGALAV